MVFFLQFEHVRSYHDPRAQDSARGPSGGGFAPDVKLLTALCGALERASAWQQALGWAVPSDGSPPILPPQSGFHLHQSVPKSVFKLICPSQVNPQIKDIKVNWDVDDVEYCRIRSGIQRLDASVRGIWLKLASFGSSFW
jgi:hypothetical protein